MPKISNIEILQTREQPVIMIRTRAKVEDLPMLIGESYGKMAAYLKATGEFLSEVPYVAYHNMDMRNLDVEIGFPVARALPGQEDIHPRIIPGGKAVYCLYQGAYSDMEPLYGEIFEWIAKNNYTPSGAFYEFYYNGPEFPENLLLTKVLVPVV